ncbi:hypothetical protein ACUOFC_06860, partial [Escherichia sp. TWPC-MK]
MSGPPKTPTHLRLVRGNPSKRPINENEPKPAAGVPPTPKHFDKQGKYWFKRMAEELDSIGNNLPRHYPLGIADAICNLSHQ